MLANLLQTVYNMVDTVVVGQFVGADGLSAVTNCGEIIQFYTFIAIGFGSAGQTMIGQFIGAKETERVKQIIGTLFTTLFGLAVAVMILVFATWRGQLGLINLPEEAMSGGRDYMLVCCTGMIFIFGYNLVSAIMRGMGDSKRPLLFIAIASIVNLVLDLLFVPVLHMGAFGAALATVIGQAVAFLWAITYLYRNRADFGFDFKLSSFVPEKKVLGMLFRLGVPMTIQGAFISISMIYVTSLINVFGVAASAANGITYKMANVARMVANSMSTAGAAMIAQCIGAGKLDRVKQVYWWDFGITMISSTLCAIAIFFFPQQVFSVFNTESDVLAFAAVYAPIGVLDFFGFAFRVPNMAVINGTGAATLGLIGGLMDGVVARIALSILLGNVLGMGVAGYWWGNALAGYVTVLIYAPYFFSGRWKKRRLVLDK